MLGETHQLPTTYVRKAPQQEELRRKSEIDVVLGFEWSRACCCEVLIACFASNFAFGLCQLRIPRLLLCFGVTPPGESPKNNHAQKLLVRAWPCTAQ